MKFKIGDHVQTTGDYMASGEVRGTFTLADDRPEVRYIVSHYPDGGGVLALIYREDEIEPCP